jgi:hypothetical protein
MFPGGICRNPFCHHNTLFFTLDCMPCHKKREIRCTLLSSLELQGMDIPGQMWEAVTLTSFVSNIRYPGTAIPVTKEEYHEAVRLAQEILRWAQEQTG